uniref:Uncharacterized protein n=1 Tax=Vibrio parahaemolyticus TaxID=670 RepID=A0A6C0VUL5_VIBPH|nr:hypothetical protein [Vibrio parahaemolyticus]
MNYAWLPEGGGCCTWELNSRMGYVTFMNILMLKYLAMNGHYALTDWHGGLQLWRTVLYSVYHTFSMATVVME